METVLITAFVVGGATVLGSTVGFIFRGISQKFAHAVLSFAAGVMMAASVWGLVDPALESGVAVTVVGIFTGAFALSVINRVVQRLGCFTADEGSGGARVILFVTAIAIHNLPEGIAAGVGFGTGDVSRALTIAGGIALQNIPEGMVIIGPMMAVGFSRRKTFLCALFSGFLEVVGTLMGYYAVHVAAVILPFALAFAGGTMLYVIVDEMIPDTHRNIGRGSSTYAFLVGFCFTVVFNAVIQ